MQHQTLQNLVGRADALINAGQFDALMDFYCDDATLVVKPASTPAARRRSARRSTPSPGTSSTACECASTTYG